MNGYVWFINEHPEIPWQDIRGMRNRMIHGYRNIKLDKVWDTVQHSLPELLKQLPALLKDAASKDRNGKRIES
jgi:uncharacterized protein with HEPN domain